MHNYYSEKMAVVDSVSALLVAFMLACYISNCHGQSYPFRNTSLSFEERVKVYSSTIEIFCGWGGDKWIASSQH